MKMFILFTLTIIVFNILILLFPIIFFLLSLTLANSKIFDLFLWLYIPLAIFSPVLTLLIGYKIASLKTGAARWILPVIISFAGFSPIWLTYLSVAAILSLQDFLLIFLAPILLGLTSTVLFLINRATFHKRSSYN